MPIAARVVADSEIDHNLLKQYLKVLALYFVMLRAIFKAFYGLFCFKNHKPLLPDRILIVF